MDWIAHLEAAGSHFVREAKKHAHVVEDSDKAMAALRDASAIDDVIEAIQDGHPGIRVKDLLTILLLIRDTIISDHPNDWTDPTIQELETKIESAIAKATS